ncbi:MAG: hypothetical protein PUP91_05850 [Rhizonema sp. PD37]|nr:hypothetical protein [Rhizonema sp. PD37]
MSTVISQSLTLEEFLKLLELLQDDERLPVLAGIDLELTVAQVFG